MSRLKQHFIDVKPITKRMTAEDREWYRNFVLGYHGGHSARLKAVCKDDEQYARLRKDSIYVNHSHQRMEDGGTQRSYTPEDWVTEDSIALSFEDALIDAIDAGISVDSVIGFEKINIQNQETRSGTDIEDNEGDAA